MSEEGSTILGEKFDVSEFDAVERPSHYTEGRCFETIHVIEDWNLGYHLGNTVKYISRAGRKGNTLEDLQKARWYLDRFIELVKAHAEALEVLPKVNS